MSSPRRQQSIQSVTSRTLACIVPVVILLASAQVIRAAESPATTRPAAQSSLGIKGVGQDGQITLTVNRSTVVNTTRPYRRVSTSQPEIADINAISPTSVLVTAKKPGNTQLILWDDQDRADVVDIVVEYDLKGLRDQFGSMFPNSNIEVSAANGTIVLRGRVGSVDTAEQAEQIAAPYSGKDKVLNFLEVAGGQQVMLQVRFAEVSRSALSALGVNAAFAAGSSFGGSNIGQVNPTALVPGEGSFLGDTPAPEGLLLTGDQAVSPAVTLYGGGQIGSFFLEAFVEALRRNNLLRILAEPNLIAISGQEAAFLAGGEYPIPVAQGGAGAGTAGTAITVEFKEFGVRLVFVPVVLGNGQIRLKVAPEVSNLDFTTAVRFNGFVIPGLNTRRVATTIELGDGQSFAIAGLLNSSVIASKDVVPLLGDLPVVGALFRSVRYQRSETELVVLVTPRLVSPMNPDRIPPLPGELWRHPTENELFWNKDLGGTVEPGADEAAAGDRAAPLFQGHYGYAPATQPAAPVE